MKRIDVFGGGTVAHVRPHLAVAAPAYGNTARTLAELFESAVASGLIGEHEVHLRLTKMADARSSMETSADVGRAVDELIEDERAHVVVMSSAICDYDATVVGDAAGMAPKSRARLETSRGEVTLRLTPAEKIIGRLRATRKDLFVVGFKATAGASALEQYQAGLRLLKTASLNLVLANDVHTRRSMVITPEQARYHETTNRRAALEGLVEMTALRSQLAFTRSTVVPGEPVPWSSPLVPPALRAVVDHAIARGAYRPFLGATVGHFAVKLDGETFLTSRRKTDFNRLSETGLVRVVAGPDRDRVIAFGARPSVGGQSQRIIFEEHPDLDCIVHFHCALKRGSRVPVSSQRPFECGSHECGRNTSRGLAPFDGVWAVMLAGHGPNVVFSRNADPERVIAFIEENFDLDRPTDAEPVSLEPVETFERGSLSTIESKAS